MKTWYEKCYGEPPPVNNKLIVEKPVFKEYDKKEKKKAWEKAKLDYLEYLRQNDVS